MTAQTLRAHAALFAAVLTMLLWLPGCGETTVTPASSAATGSAAPRAGWPDDIVFGLVPSEGGADIVARFAPLTAFLSDRLGTPVVAKPASEYAGVITAMQNEQVHLAYYGPKSYVEAERIAGAEVIVKELNADGRPGYKGVIVVHANSPAETLADTRGMTFAFVTPNSTSGYLVPSLGIAREMGEQAEDFYSQIRYTGSHGSSMNAVIRGDVQVAATNTLDMHAMVEAGQVDGDALKVIWTSQLIPSAPIAVHENIPDSLKEALRDAFIAFNNEPELLEQMSRGGFLLAVDSEYDIIRMLELREADLTKADD